MENPFFINHGPFKISEILNILNLKKQDINFDQKVKNINDLYSAENSDISFFHSKKYKDLAINTKAAFCLTTQVLKNDLQMYINSDDDIIEVEKKIVYYEAIVEFIDGVIKSIDNRGWDIRNAQDWKKFLAGGY